MRIAFVSTMASSAWGGSEQLWCDCARAAIAKGHTVFVSVVQKQSIPEPLHDLESRGARIHFRRRGIHRRLDEPLARLRPRFRALAAFKPDVVCISQGASYEAAINGDFLELRHWLERSNAKLVLICQLNHDCASLNDSRRTSVRELFARAAWVAFVSERNLREARRHLAIPLANGLVVRNPVNLTDQSEVPWPQDDHDARWASVARLETAYKGQDALMEALSDKIWLQRPWRVTLYGTGPDERYLRELAAHYGLTERFVFAGHVKNVRSIWASNHMLLLPSREEGTPLSMVEAMLCGRSALVTDVAGNTEWIDDDNGFVAGSARVSALAPALERAWTSRSHWQDLGRRARATALAKIDTDAPGSLLGLIERAVQSA